MIAEVISRLFMWGMALFFAVGVYVSFPRESHLYPGTEIFFTLMCAVACVGSIIGSFYCYDEPPME